jgi:outer membrane protein assembly factor BamD
MKKANLLFVLLFPVLLLSCSKYQKTLRSADYDTKYKAAIGYFDKKDYSRALPLFEELITVYRGTAKAEQVAWYFARSQYEVGDLMLASFHFKEFYRTFPNSLHAEEALFKNAYCYYLNSPPSSLDQANTLSAIEEFQLFVNLFPESQRVSEANELIDKLRGKLEKKAFDNARLFYDIGEYKAAIQCFNNLSKDFPDTRYREEGSFLQLKAAYLLAINSIESKKQERFKQTESYCKRFEEQFPASRYKSQTRSIMDICQREIQKLKSST